ncbi:4Fe-4S dicluster domain-containing protein [Endozoicomonas sp. 4G]|uniref:4Fe-4S dicluster domain-containing protein n=1 Tax=Endozoicomonas sp. 4G TaxID=2872754 RepID=UPI00207881FF|nr:4Fe-4S dicluster domain-containing protein [Endozoicomonas sp. 4G]
MLDRRKALKLLSAGAAAFTFVSAQGSLSSIRKEKNKKHLAMAIDLRRCNGCKACVTSCGVENGNEPDEHRTQVVQVVAESGDKQHALNLPLLCNHCEEPACTPLCPTGATFKREEDGIVVVDSTVCVGCNYCAMACPYTGVRFTNSKTSTIDKCNFCIHRTTRNLLPACVESCTGAARIFGDVNNPDSQISKFLDENEVMVLQSDKNTRPNVFYVGLSQEEADQPYTLHIENTWQR